MIPLEFITHHRPRRVMTSSAVLPSVGDRTNYTCFHMSVVTWTFGVTSVWCHKEHVRNFVNSAERTHPDLFSGNSKTSKRVLMECEIGSFFSRCSQQIADVVKVWQQYRPLYMKTCVVFFCTQVTERRIPRWVLPTGESLTDGKQAGPKHRTSPASVDSRQGRCVCSHSRRSRRHVRTSCEHAASIRK
jgi:hypothetical protein